MSRGKSQQNKRRQLLNENPYIHIKSTLFFSFFFQRRKIHRNGQIFFPLAENYKVSQQMICNGFEQKILFMCMHSLK